ncbi:MCM2/3/5 family protein, partial [Toxoplasma gondii FOU]
SSSSSSSSYVCSPAVSQASSQNTNCSDFCLPVVLASFLPSAASSPPALPEFPCPLSRPVAGARSSFAAFSAAVLEASAASPQPWTRAALDSLREASPSQIRAEFLRFLATTPSHLFTLGLYVSAATNVSAKSALFASLLSAQTPGGLSSSAAAFWRAVALDPQRRALHEMVSTVSFEVDLLSLLHQAPLLGAAVVNKPRETLAFLETDVVRDVAASLLRHMQSCGDHDMQSKEAEEKRQEEQLLLRSAPPLKIRLTHIPKDKYMERRTPLQIRTSDEGKLVVITGRVARAGDLQAVEEERTMSCRQCGECFRVFACAEQGYQLDIPLKCPAGSAAIREQLRARAASQEKVPQRGRGGFWGRRRGPCEGETFDSLGEATCLMDYQEIKLRCSLAGARKYLSRDPAHRALLPVVLLRHLAGTVSMGDIVTVVGIVGRRWQRVVRDMRSERQLYPNGNPTETTR